MDSDHYLVKLVTRIDNIVADKYTEYNDLQFLANVRADICVHLRDQIGEYEMRELPICRCECHFDITIEYHNDVCDDCKCYNENRGKN